MYNDSSSSSSARPPSAFGELLRRFRLTAGLSQEELAGRAGLSPRGVSDLERGARTNPRPGTVRLLADALALSDTDRAAFLAAAQGSAAPNRSAGYEAEAAPLATESHTPAPMPPTGTVTFLFTDIEGSTKLLQRLGPRYAGVLGDHQRLLRAAFAAHNGYEVDTQGDSFFVAFPTAPDGLGAAVDAARALAEHDWPEETLLQVRMGLHSGSPQLAGDCYVGLDVHRAARIAAAGYGGQILLSAAAAELARHGLPEYVTLRDLGAHRLKDLQLAEKVYQAVVSGLPADFPPLHALDARPHNLPVQPTPLLGREREMAAVCALLRRDDVRLVTLTGPGGIGKTRLSVQVAAEVLDTFPDGVWNVRLARLTDPDLVVPTIATTLGLKEGGATPLAEVLRGYLRDKHLLLVLDNFEQVVAAASQVGELLAVCPDVKVLVTSRVRLHLHGEHEYTLRPLALPDPAHLPPPERLSQYAAVALFIERAQAAQADFAVTNATAPAVAEICARLDGLPLAIELAAARVKLLPPPALLKRLEHALPVLVGGARDLDERQQTMRATLQWSYDLLAPEEQRLFRRLAVFVGGCTLEAVEAVCGTPEGAKPLELDVLDGLASLVDQSLIQQREEAGEPRFIMLYIIREFALEQLEASGEAEALRRAHAAYVLTWTSDTPLDAPRVEGDAQWLARLEREHDNIRAAVGWSLDHKETSLGLRLGVGFGPFWHARGYYSEGRRWLEEILASGLPTQEELPSNGSEDRPSASSALQRIWALLNVAGFAGNQLDTMRAREWVYEALDAARASGNVDVTVVALCMAGFAEVSPPAGDVARGDALLQEALAMARRSSDNNVLLSAVSYNMRSLVGFGRELDRAQVLAEELLDLARLLRYPFIESYAEWNLAEVALFQNDAVAARERADHALRLVRENGITVWAQTCIEVLALVADRESEFIRAARLFGATAALTERMGMFGYMAHLETEMTQSVAYKALSEEAWAAAFATGKALSLDEAIAEALGEDIEMGRETQG